MPFLPSSPDTVIVAPRPVRNATKGLGKDRRAFTLLEILIALAIIGLLVGLAISNISGIFGNSQRDIVTIFVNSSMSTPLNTYRLGIGDYPSTAEGLQALAIAPAGKSDRWRGPYVTENKWPPLDPWGEPYQYRYPGTRNKASYDLWSKGVDKQDGTADDIGNWPATAEAAK